MQTTTKVKHVISHARLAGNLHPTDSVSSLRSYFISQVGAVSVGQALISSLVNTVYHLCECQWFQKNTFPPAASVSHGGPAGSAAVKGRGGLPDPLGDLSCFNHGPHVDFDKRARLESPSALLLQGEPSRLGVGCGLSRCSHHHSRPPVYLLWRLFYPR